MVVSLILSLMLQGGVFTSYAGGQRWDFNVRGQDVEKGPRWRETDDAPPLPPRTAVRSARGLLSRLFTDGPDWELGRVSLQQVAGTRDAWLYLVEFSSPLKVRPGALAGSAVREHMTVVVMMDGTAITPVRRAGRAGKWHP
jgi:hypothetical protein